MAKNRYFTDQNGPTGGPHENEFRAFSNSEMNITNRLEKIDKKNGVICLVSMFPFWVMVFKLSEKCICADLSKKSKSIKAIYVYASERSRYALSEIDVANYTMNFWEFSAELASFLKF